MNELKVIYKPLEQIKVYANNPRFNDEAVEYVAKSIKEFGFKVPIIIDKNNVIVAGHTRYKASMELGLNEVPCIVADDLTEEQVKAFRLADNKVSEKSEWNFELLDEELEDLDINMEDFGFENVDIEWDNVENLSEEKYEEPQHEMLECPKCHHVDRKIHFKKVENE
jgi:site-specific DNA-methyltransferase (adenine-specific)